MSLSPAPAAPPLPPEPASMDATPAVTSPPLSSTPAAAMSVIDSPAEHSTDVQQPEAEVEMEASPSIEDAAAANAASGHRPDRGNRNMTFDERREMLDFLLARRTDSKSKLARNAINEAALEFRVDRRTVSRLWKRAVASLEKGEPMCDVASRKVGRQGRRKRDWSAALDKVREIPMEQRGSIRALASAVGIPKTTLFELLREDASPNRVLNSIKPALTDRNKVERLRYCQSKVRATGLFDDMFNMVHLNVKWFALPRDKKVKVMCMGAIARPQWDPARGAYFDGKIGIWPFLKEIEVGAVGGAGAPEAAKTPEGKTETMMTIMDTVSKDDVQRMITNVVIPQIRHKLPAHMKDQPIYIQQDSAKVRSPVGDPVIAEEGRKLGWNISLQSLPAYSPDFTVMDNALFKHIETWLKTAPVPPLSAAISLLEELVTGVQQGYEALTQQQLDEAFLSLQKVLECTMLVQGSNTYELGNTGREMLQHEGSLPVSILCRPDAILACRSGLEGLSESIV